MIKKTKKKLRMVYTSELKLLENRYEDMAKKGWMIEKVTGTFDKFVETESADLDFSVTLFQPDLGIDYPDTEKRATYREFCEDSGWKYICHNNLFFVYAKPKNSDVISIHTDPKSEFSSLYKSFLKTEAMLIILLLIQVFQLSMHLNHLTYRDFINSQLLFNFVTPLVLGMMLIVVITPSMRFIIKNYFRVRKGKEILYDSLKKIKRNNYIRSTTMIICAIYLALTFGNLIFKGVPTSILVTVILTQIIMWSVFGLFFLKVKKIKHSRTVNTLILIVLFFVVWIGSIVAIFTIVGSQTDYERPVYELPEMEVLTFKDLNYDYPFEPEVEYVDSSVFVPLSFDYLVSYGEGDNYTYLNVEYIETQFDWIKEMMIPLIFKYEWRHSDESPLDVEESLLNSEDVRIYKLREDQSRILLIEDHLIYIVTMNEPIVGELLDNVIGGLIER